MRKLNLKKIITMGLITISILAVGQVGVSAAWEKDYTNAWLYKKSDGAYAKGWLLQGNTWYYFDNYYGHMKTGWLLDNGNWYYFKADGSMVSGQASINGRTAIFDANGAWKGYSDSVQTNGDSFTRETALDYINNFGYTTYEGVEFKVTSGGYNGCTVNDTIYKTHYPMDEYRYRVFGKIDKRTGDYVGVLMVLENGVTVDYSAGSFSNDIDPSFDERQFDAKGTWQKVV